MERNERNGTKSKLYYGVVTPTQHHYRASERIYTGKIEPYEYDKHGIIRRAKGSGEIKWQGKSYYLSQVLAHEPVAFELYGDGIWRIYYRFQLLGELHEREQKIVPLTQWHNNTL